MNSTEKKHLMDGENVSLIKLYGESFTLTSNVFVIVCHIFDVLLIKLKPKNITLRKIIERGKIGSTKIHDL